MRERLTVFCAAFALVAVSIAISHVPPAIPQWSCTTGKVRLLAFAPNDCVFAVLIGQPSDRNHYQFHVVDARNNETLLKIHGLVPTNLAFNSDGSQVAVLWADALKVYEVHSGEVLLEIKRQLLNRDLHSLAFSDDGHTLVIASHFRLPPHVEVAWDLHTGQQIDDYGESSHWSGHGLAPDRSKWYGGGWPGPTPRVFQCNDQHRITYCFRHPYHIFASFTPDSRNLFTLHEDGAMFLWELRDTDNDNAAMIKSELNTGLENSSAFALLHNSKQLAYVDPGGTLRFKRLFTHRR